MQIIVDDLTSPEIHALLEEHLRGMRAASPPESVFALDIDALRRPEITFFTARKINASGTNQLLACGAIKELDKQHGEIKSMRTSAKHLRQGAGAAILTHILDVAQRRGYSRLYLETGSTPPFDPAIAMYERFGFSRCGPFAGYVENPFSVFMLLNFPYNAD